MKKMMYFAAALLVLVGCNKKDNSIENTPKEVVTIKGSIELPQTPHKIAAPTDWESETQEFGMRWEENDQIYIYNGLGECSLFTIASGAGDSEASFNGSPLSSMDSYSVAYGYNPKGDYKGEATYPTYPVPYVEGNYRPFAEGLGTTEGFEINTFGPVVGLQLKGDGITLSKIEVVLYDNVNKVLGTFTMPFEGGLALNTDNVTKVYFPLKNEPAEKLKIKFYEVISEVETLIMVKAVKSENMPEAGKINNYPELNVIVSPSPMDVFTNGNNMSLGLLEKTSIYDFTYQYNSDAFNLVKILYNGTDVTSQVSGACSITNTGNYTFKFTMGGGTFYYDAQNETYKRAYMFGNVNFNSFKVEDVDILDRLDEIIVTPDPKDAFNDGTLVSFDIIPSFSSKTTYRFIYKNNAGTFELVQILTAQTNADITTDLENDCSITKTGDYSLNFTCENLGIIVSYDAGAKTYKVTITGDASFSNFYINEISILNQLQQVWD